MALTQDPVAPRPTVRRRPAGWVPLALALGSAAAFGVFFLVPYFANGLHHVALGEVVGGAHDPKGLWPFDQGAVGGGFMLGAYLTMFFGPLVAAVAAGWAVLDLWRNRGMRDLGRTTRGILTLAVAALTVAWLVSPLGAALLGWMLD